MPSAHTKAQELNASLILIVGTAVFLFAVFGVLVEEGKWYDSVLRGEKRNPPEKNGIEYQHAHQNLKFQKCRRNFFFFFW